ncbi:permease [Paenibacillus sp. HB172176]|uniref:permease n=1 Tax=Paenibacillus sp. HB172176 TaxID=2493690 RepID=UPI001F0D52BA|nr:permease [Paenibacillus sp. HB172176]
MRQGVFNSIIAGLSIIIMGMIAMIFFQGQFNLDWIHAAALQSFKIVFISILLEALPFILIGVLFSSLIQVFVSDAFIRRFAPKNPVAGVLIGGLLGVVFPLCECGMIPVIRRLIRKGMPSYMGIVYLLAGPIVNPVVYASTFTAFRATPEIAYARMILGYAVAAAIGFILYAFMKKSPLKESRTTGETEHLQREAHSKPHSHTHSHPPRSHEHEARPSGFFAKIGSALSHASEEFFDMGKYLLFGALLTAMMQTVVSREMFVQFADHAVLSYLFMMAFAFVLSICSTSDSFIAASFTGIFHSGPILAFLVLGPMMDVKNLLMLLSSFRLKFVAALTLLIVVLTGISCWIIGGIL